MLKMTISDAGARLGLAMVWLFFFTLNLTVVLYLYLANWIEVDNFWSAMHQLNAVYVVYVGAVTAFYWMRRRKGSSSNSSSGAAFILAVICSILWNGMISTFIAIRLPLAMGTIEDSIKQIGYLGPLFSWMVAPAMGFYFAHPYGRGKANNE